MVNYPDGWTLSTVDQIVDIGTGCRDTQDNIPYGRYKFFVRSPIVERIDVADYDCEAVLTAGDGVGTGKVFHYVNGLFSAHQRVYVMNNFRNVLGKYFFYYFSKYFIYEVEKYTAKSSVDSVRRPMIAEMEIPLPTIKEQQRIIETISTFDTHIANLTELIEKKMAIREGALEELVNGRTRLKGFNSERKTLELGSIATIQDGTHGTFKRTSTGFYLLSAKNVFNNRLVIGEEESKVSEYDYNRIRANGYPQKGDILLSCVGTIGRCCILQEDNYVFQRSVAFIRTTNICNRYLAYVLQSKDIQGQLQSMVNASAQGGIYLGSLRKVEITITLDNEEQEAIANTLTAMDAEIEALEIERNKMIQIREGAMDDLLTGKVRLTD
ncbi:MAG: restriction endonuclease subunit S [Ruminococcus flavefaciens]